MNVRQTSDVMRYNENLNNLKSITFGARSFFNNKVFSLISKWSYAIHYVDLPRLMHMLLYPSAFHNCSKISFSNLASLVSFTLIDDSFVNTEILSLIGLSFTLLIIRCWSFYHSNSFGCNDQNKPYNRHSKHFRTERRLLYPLQ